MIEYYRKNFYKIFYLAQCNNSKTLSYARLISVTFELHYPVLNSRYVNVLLKKAFIIQIN